MMRMLCDTPYILDAGDRTCPKLDELDRIFDEVLSALGSSAEGLSAAEAAIRQDRYGPNQLAPPQPASLTEIVLSQLRSVIVVLLLAAVIISILSGDRLEAIAIAAVLVINTVLGVVTELRARRAIEALLALDVPHASVVREGRLQVIRAIDLVPGDVIIMGTDGHCPQLLPGDTVSIEIEGIGTLSNPVVGEER